MLWIAVCLHWTCDRPTCLQVCLICNRYNHALRRVFGLANSTFDFHGSSGTLETPIDSDDRITHEVQRHLVHRSGRAAGGRCTSDSRPPARSAGQALATSHGVRADHACGSSNRAGGLRKRVPPITRRYKLDACARRGHIEYPSRY